MVGLIDVKRKGSALVPYWVWYVTLTFDLTHDLYFGCFNVKFRNSCVTGIVGLIDVKWKGSGLIGYTGLAIWPHLWPHPWPWPWSFKVRVSNSLISGISPWNGKDVSHPFMNMILTSVTMVGWADLLDSDRGDFGRRRTVDISSCLFVFIYAYDYQSWQCSILAFLTNGHLSSGIHL